MNVAPSIAQEFYKIREEWERVEKLKSWKLAIWVAQYADVDIIDKFIEIERLPIGVFDEIFFRFDARYQGDMVEFERQLWLEYQLWFTKPDNPQQDIIQALKNDGTLHAEFTPRFTPDSGFTALLHEMLRLRSHLKGFENSHFCLYFPPDKVNRFMLGDWLNLTLKKEFPPFIRMVTIDHASSRKILISSKDNKVVELTPQLNMSAAINNEIDNRGGNNDTVSPEARLGKQIRVVMESIIKKNKSLTDTEVKKMLVLAKQTADPSTLVTALLVASQAHYHIKDHAPSERYAEEAIAKAEKEMEKNNPAGYHSWKACMMLKGALLSSKRKWEAAITVYDDMADKALKNNDTFYVMEGYRISGHIYYVRGRLQPAFEKSLKALVAGSYLGKEMIRQSTFMHAAHLAVFLGEKIKPQDELQALYEQLDEWVGTDWKDILSNRAFEKSTAKPRGKFVPPMPFAS